MFNFSKPTLITLTGTTCSGKTHLHDFIISTSSKSDIPCVKIKSFTTRSPRPGEVDGVDYDFISEYAMRDLLQKDELIEMNKFLGNFYGVTKSTFNDAFMVGDPVLIADPNGVAVYEKVCEEQNIDLIKVFVHVPLNVVEERLKNRLKSELEKIQRDNIDEIMAKVNDYNRRRDNVFTEEIKWSGKLEYDVIVPGNDVETAVSAIKQHMSWKKRKNEIPTAFDGL